MCPRCHAVVSARKKNPYSRSMALLLAAGLMYLPANIYPIATIPIDLRPTSYTAVSYTHLDVYKRQIRDRPGHELALDH